MTSNEQGGNGKNLPHEGHTDTDIAYHIVWPYSSRAFMWNDKPKKQKRVDPCGVNFQPIANQLRLWLLRQGGVVSYFSHKKEGRGLVPTNPYTESASVLALMYADVMGETHTFVTSSDHMEEIDAEIRRACKKAGRGHKISLLGSLPHRFHLCLEVEHCLDKHLSIANTRRNSQASHATFTGFDPRPVEQVRERFDRELKELAEEMIHMLQHIGKIELAMEKELQYALSVGMQDPWWNPV